MENKSERKMSLSFLLLVMYVLLTISNIGNVFKGLFTPLLYGFGSITTFISYVMNIILEIISVFAPIFLIVLLWLNKKQNVKKIAQIVLLAVGIVQCYFVLHNLRSLFSIVISGNFFNYSFLQIISGHISTIMLAILYILGFLSLKSDKKNEKNRKYCKSWMHSVSISYCT